ncbi:GNAT family N-acetyltransferase [Cesiribacter andamanensis]|uniref:Putative acetyltransferase n=1 Tax=Cesiribacter andamanensis AMV16 TaxID=1279009 RepID=M7MZD4_9BACT|nr:GNAT family N-acetyltransferase [Cesiribacter andamanensis]EMR01773.1 putative acetyltransferase [Cesiribacter andamanensis AMV16]
MTHTPNITIRTGTRQDLPQVLALIKELAEYERAPQEVDNTVERMEQDGFGPQKVFDFLVAEQDGRILGLALYYWSYSTWKGKCMYLEDLVITQPHRRFGIGRRLFDRLIQIAKEKDVRRLSWQVLDWNEPAIEFYKGLGAQLDGEWINGRLTYEQLQAMG